MFEYKKKIIETFCVIPTQTSINRQNNVVIDRRQSQTVKKKSIHT